jgi:hypothetical protein
MMRMRRIGSWPLLIFASALALAQTAAPKQDLLPRFRAQMLENMSHQPNYTCLETVERSRQTPGSAVQMRDTLRLEVALVDGKEMFAWPGSKQFEDKDLREIVSTGMFGNGNYGLYSRILFGGNGPAFKYEGEVPLSGRSVAHFSYRVPVSLGGHELRVDEHTAVTGFHGSIYLDPATADLRRLEVFADDIPPQLGLTAAEDRVDYDRVAIGDEKFLLPVESALLMASKNSIDRNRVRFSGCHKFAGDSSVIFDESELPTEGDAVATAPKEVALPPDTSLVIEIRSDTVLELAATGDSVTGSVRSDVKIGKQVVIPKGAMATGRILALQRFSTYLVLAVALQEIEWPGGHASFTARPDSLATPRLAGVGQIYLSPEGLIRYGLPAPRTLRGQQWIFRTVQ